MQKCINEIYFLKFEVIFLRFCDIENKCSKPNFKKGYN